jgi:hypothetical protein
MLNSLGHGNSFITLLTSSQSLLVDHQLSLSCVWLCVGYIVVNKAPPPFCLLSVCTVVAGLIVVAIGTLASFVCAPGTCHRLLPSCNIANH